MIVVQPLNEKSTGTVLALMIRMRSAVTSVYGTGSTPRAPL
jgi:hypothetical protein